MRSPLKWFGGKSALAERITARFPPHRCYVEVFGGAGWVLFRKEPSKSEILNDINGDLANLYRVLRDNLAEFMARAELLLPSRSDFEMARDGYLAQDGAWKSLPAVDRALGFYTLVNHSFAVNLHTFKAIVTRPPARVNLDLLRKGSRRLQRVWIEEMDFERLIKRYDSPETLFYLDPPYAPASFAGQAYGWPDEEHDRLRSVLENMRGRFIMSYPDWPRFTTLYRDMFVEHVSVRYRFFQRGTTPHYGNELLISNYDTSTVTPRARPNITETVVNPDAYA
jgi:DNA adenine methylase